MKKKKSQHNPFYAGSGFRILGIGKQEAIKYFFGGNATIAIIVIGLIIGFLIYHSANFFPQYRSSLELYRKSGQEFVDYSAEQLAAQEQLKSLSTHARAYEIQERLGALYNVASVHSDLKAQALKTISSERKHYKRAKSRYDNLKSEENPNTDDLKSAQKYYEKVREALKAAAQTAVDDLDYGDLSNRLWATNEKYLASIRNSIVENLLSGEKTAFLQEIEAEEKRMTEQVDSIEFISNLIKANQGFSEAIPPLKGYVTGLREIASQNKAQAVNYVTAKARKDALEDKLAITTNVEDQKRTRLEMKRILDVEPDYAKLNKPLYNSLDKHQEITTAVTEKNKVAFALLPDASEFQSKISRRKIDEIQKIKETIGQLFSAKSKQMESWDHSTSYPLSQAVIGFFFGTKWITNSSWQDIYGIVPLLTGSVACAIIAILIAIPFSVGGAIYVNRLSTSTEQHIIKPFIEFIGAIPSIVLAFFGVVVLGTLIQEYSQSPWLSWIPGFPVEGRLTIMNAGLLLALMSVPTIFTLCEDALNNVPKAYKEASLALGATKLQTVTKVILPSCGSGIIAAILLGFGRIIGETMVVLLVMGGRIAIPQSFTDPAHSMTGILAQEIGEVDEGSLHWGALFMVGLVLFVIALSLNYISQRILKKFTQHG
ncbi:MAG: phosphate ABC transporter permease subunit PstC [Akkermansiaceae bacterium]|nr:phosphate ABC transporter permease subunit PstC [Akkermansiaceae bacterium]